MTVPQLYSSAEERAKLLKHAERLWQELQDNELGGFSGINRPFWIAEALKQAFRDGIAAERKRTREIDTAKDAVIEAAREMIDEMMDHGAASAEKQDELLVALATLAAAIERGPETGK